MRTIRTTRNVVIKHGEGDDLITLTYRFPLAHEKDYTKIREFLQFPSDPEEAKAYVIPADLNAKLFNNELIDSLIAVEGYESDTGEPLELTREVKEILFDQFEKDVDLYNKITAARANTSGKN